MELLSAFARFTFSLAIDLALFALGWGVDDLGGFFKHPARVALVVLVVAQAVFVHVLRWKRESFGRRHMLHVGLLRIQLAAMETIYVFGPFADRRGLALMPEGARWWGLALFTLGLVLIDWAYLRWPARLVSADGMNAVYRDEEDFTKPSGQIMRERAARLREQRVGTGEEFEQGPFRWLRYPNLLATVIVGVGAAMIFRAWPAMICAGLALVVILLRVREIEQVYLREYGSSWAQYSERTKKLIPFVF